MGVVVRHPFDAAPYVASAVGAWAPVRVGGHGFAPGDRTLTEPDRVWLRGLRPETRALWLVTGGSALASVLVYWGFWGLPIACGLVLGMWGHELGHLHIARKLGLEVGPIVFVPFIGATQRLRTPPANALAGAQLALAGPLCGLLFAVACKLGFLASRHPALALLGTAHALLSILDAVPFGMLDGKRIFAALSRRHRAACACATASLALVTQSWFLVPVCAIMVWTATRPAPVRSPKWIAAVYSALIIAGSLLV